MQRNLGLTFCYAHNIKCLAVLIIRRVFRRLFLLCLFLLFLRRVLRSCCYYYSTLIPKRVIVKGFHFIILGLVATEEPTLQIERSRKSSIPHFTKHNLQNKVSRPIR